MSNDENKIRFDRAPSDVGSFVPTGHELQGQTFFGPTPSCFLQEFIQHWTKTDRPRCRARAVVRQLLARRRIWAAIASAFGSQNRYRTYATITEVMPMRHSVRYRIVDSPSVQSGLAGLFCGCMYEHSSDRPPFFQKVMVLEGY